MRRVPLLMLGVFLGLSSCDRPPAPASANPPPAAAPAAGSPWERGQYQPGGGDALMLFAVFGSFDGGLQLSRSRHRCGGPPEGVKVTQLQRAKDAGAFENFERGAFGEVLAREPSLAAAVRSAPHCVLIRGTVRDPKDLKYLRDTVGVVTAALDSGGVAVLDSQRLTWWSPGDWRGQIFEPDAPQPRRHVVILVSEEAGGTVWIHTRGLRKFGRPDLSVHRVKPEHREAVLDLCNRFIEMQAFGAQIPEGQPIRMSTLPAGMTCHHGGNLDDVDFNNVHLDIRWP